MAFDPDKYLAQTGSSGRAPFDPDAYLSGKYKSAPAVLQQGAGQAALDSAGNAALLGYGPQVIEGVSRAVAPLYDAVTGSNVTEHLGDYTASRDETVKHLAAEQAEHPVASAVGMAGGALLSGAATAGMLPIQGATKLATLGRATLAGAGQAAAINPGETAGQIDPVQLMERLENAKTGALFGAGGQAASSLASGGLALASKLPGGLKNFAEDRAFKSSGAMLRDYRKQLGRGGVRDVGRLMLDRGIVRPGGTYDDVAAAAGSIRRQEGSKLGNLIQELGLDEALSNGKAISRSASASKLRTELLGKGGIGATQRNNAKFSKWIDEFERGGSETLGVAEAQELRRSVDDLINWDRMKGADIPLEEQFHRGLRGELESGIETQAEELAKLTGRGGDYQASKKAYGAATSLEGIAKDRTLREQANRMFSPTDYLSGGLGAAAGFASGDDMESRLKNAAIGLGIGGANKVARSYGNPVVAKGSDKIASLLAQHPNLLGAFARPAADGLAKGAGSYALNAGIQRGRFTEAAGGASPEDLPSNPRLMELFKKNPELIEAVQNPNLKAAIEKRLGREPGSKARARIKALESK